MESFFFWWSIVSTIVAVGFLMWNIWQLASRRKEQDLHKGQVKLWQHHANGINAGLYMIDSSIESSQYSSIKDIQQSIKALSPNAQSLYNSLNEERLFTDAEIKEEQLKQKKQREELIENFRKKQESAGPQ